MALVDDPNDIDSILLATNTDRNATIATVTNNADTIFTWDYEKGARPRLNKLYE
ncbi:MAG: ferritin-like domain-containing protein, partial [Acidimicrobiales bacterium]|nr:ferritin-like domain-containing protein [Acidimicrobiales bacterium]